MSENKEPGLFSRTYNKFVPKWSRNNFDNFAGMGGVASKGIFLRVAIHNLKRIANQKTKAESFEEAVRRHGLTDADLEIKRRLFVSRSRTYYLIGFLGTLPLVYISSSYNFGMLLCALCFFFWATYSGLLQSYRAWQIQKRTLSGFLPWLKDPANWIV